MKGKSQENQFQPEIGRMTDEALESASLQSLSGARRYVRAKGAAQRSGCSLRLTEGTVRNYLSEAISKLHASNRFEAAPDCSHKGWL